MYEMVRGPLVWVAFIGFVFGLIYQGVRFFNLTERKDPLFLPPRIQPEGSRKKGFFEKVRDWLPSLRWTVWYSHPFVMGLTSIFHLSLIVTPFFVLGHNILLDESWGFGLWSFSECTTDALTVVVLFCAALFLIRRMVVKQVRAITSGYDYLVLLMTAAPFATGYFAYHQWFDYETGILLHILTGEVMLVAIPFTKLGHMLFFFFYRFLIGSEHSFLQGSRTW